VEFAVKINISKEKRLDVETPFCSKSTVLSSGLGHLSIFGQYNNNDIKKTIIKWLGLIRSGMTRGYVNNKNVIGFDPKYF